MLEHLYTFNSGLKLSIAVIVVLAISFCSANSVGFNAGGLRLAALFAQGNETSVCNYCHEVIAAWDKQPIRSAYPKPEDLAKSIERYCEAPQPQDQEICKALTEKALPFAQAYFNHMDHKDVDPCKEIQIC